MRTIRMVVSRVPHWAGLLLAAALLTFLGAGVSSAAGPVCPSPLVERQRFGFVATHVNWPQLFDFGTLKAGWVVDFAYESYSTPLAGIDRALVIPIYNGYQVDSAQLGPLVDLNPGVTWLIGNEPDSIYQNDVLPEEYARIYHNLYGFLKSRDQTSQVAAGSIVQPTPLRLEYLDQILAAYQARYGQAMPVDVWNIHNAILDEKRGAAGADIPPGVSANEGVRRDPQDNDNMTIFRDQIWAFRQWLASRGYAGYPLIVTEYGILMPEIWYGFDAQRVAAFMDATFTFFENTTDPALGDPTDGYRLVQRWAWFSLDVPPFDPFTYEGFNGNLFDPKTGVITAHGQHYASRTSSFPPLTYVDLGLGAWNLWPTPGLAGPGQPITRTLQTKIVNMGTVDSGSFTVSLEYTGPVSDQVEQTIANLPYASSQWLTFTLADLPVGNYAVSLWIDPGDQVAESRECNNQATTTILAPSDRLYLPWVMHNNDPGLSTGAAPGADRVPADSQSKGEDRARPDDIVPGFREFQVPTAASFPAQIALDAQGRVWISERDGNKIARFDPQTESWEEKAILTPGSQPWGVALDGNGDVWFAEVAANKIGKLEVASGLISEFAIPTANSQPWDVAVTGDQTVWFTEKAGNKIGKLVPATGLITEYSVPTLNAEPSGIAVLDGGVYGTMIWFAESAANRVGRLKTVNDQILEFSPPTLLSAPQDVTLTSGGNPWFTELRGNKLFVIDPETGALFAEVDLLTANSEPYGIDMEGDVAVWFTERAANRLGRYDGRLFPSEYGLPTLNSSPTGIVIDGNACAWYTAPGANQIGRLCLPFPHALYLPLITKGSAL